MKAIIRRATTHNFAAVSKIMIDCYSALAVQEGYTRVELAGLVESCSPAAIMKHWASFRVYVAEVEGTVVGVIAQDSNNSGRICGWIRCCQGRFRPESSQSFSANRYGSASMPCGAK